MGNLSSTDRERVRKGWNRARILNGNHIFADNKILPEDASGEDMLEEKLETATTVPTIGEAGVKAMINRFVEIANDNAVKNMDIYFNFAVKPFGTVLYRKRGNPPRD